MWGRPDETIFKEECGGLWLIIRILCSRPDDSNFEQEHFWWLIVQINILTIFGKVFLLPGTVPVKPSLLGISSINKKVKTKKAASLVDFILTTWLDVNVLSRGSSVEGTQVMARNITYVPYISSTILHAIQSWIINL